MPDRQEGEAVFRARDGIWRRTTPTGHQAFGDAPGRQSGRRHLAKSDRAGWSLRTSVTVSATSLFKWQCTAVTGAIRRPVRCDNHLPRPQPAQQESLVTSFSKPWAASLKPSTVVR